MYRKVEGEIIEDDFFSVRIANIEAEAVRQNKDALAMYGILEGSGPHIAPFVERSLSGNLYKSTLNGTEHGIQPQVPAQFTQAIVSVR
ncbi:uncharacterized protein LACBIDRAFT_313054 [Laccaria bicolor S238N-H82]|uniref:Predicted protein n=1 Tax=Laccaria bicolor (strain S238N-H82 / ATCC MYA-4686) TaxID=486041 RepID=B0DXF2_LACBS|nr:uncharacterized protein LACBIDRAFT_313054 [Laccaria bicolor S238N-H82]EDR00667.1 predicted protein [Laccaria bicolor S238N-H82]|eukprot:XP_001888676.1 predicted protein [Laccaria bicolor S238N-H82]